jgi:hypothetical protein
MTMIMERMGEALARQIDRRAALKGACVAGFGAVAAVVSTGFVGTKAAYAGTCQTTKASCYCNPPGGRYCNLDKCSGENCCCGCSFYYSPYSSTACWCTQTCCNFNCSSKGYYKCCDCNCSGTTCACARWVSLCGPCGPGCC